MSARSSASAGPSPSPIPFTTPSLARTAPISSPRPNVRVKLVLLAFYAGQQTESHRCVPGGSSVDGDLVRSFRGLQIELARLAAGGR
jgi:hypothetical protein